MTLLVPVLIFKYNKQFEMAREKFSFAIVAIAFLAIGPSVGGVWRPSLLSRTVAIMMATRTTIIKKQKDFNWDKNELI